MIRACQTDDVPLGEGRALDLGTRRIALFRTRTGWYAIDDRCPHAGGPLSDGLVGDCVVVCPLHERSFDLTTGACFTTNERVARYTVELRNNEVFVELEPPD